MSIQLEPIKPNDIVALMHTNMGDIKIFYYLITMVLSL